MEETGSESPYAKHISTHAVFACHGLWGEPAQLANLRNALQEQARIAGVDMVIHLCGSYKRSQTWDGIDICGDRAVKEIKDRLKEIEQSGRRVTKFSILGYSLGGLIARYIAKVLDDQGFFNEVEAVSFTAFASPMVGVPSVDSSIRQMFQSVSAAFLGRSGSQLFMRDGTSKTKPLLYRLASPEFTNALQKFRRVDIYVNAVADNLVSFLSGGLSNENPFKDAVAAGRAQGVVGEGNQLKLPGLTLTFDPKYPAIVTKCEREDKEPFEMMQFMRYEAGPPEIIQDMENAGEEKDTIDSKKEGPTERTEITPPAADLNDTPVFNRPLGPTIGELIKPWFLSSTYRFGPRNLSRVFVALHATLLSPALALGIFGYQCAASAVRVRGHLKQKEMENASAELPEPQDETRGRPIPKRSLTIEEFGPGSPILLTLEGPEATAVDDVVKFMDNQGLMTLLSIPAPQEASSDTASVNSGSSSAQERADTPSTLVAPLEIPSPQSPTQHLAPPTPLKRTSSKSSLRSILRSMSPKRREEASERTLVRTTSSSSSASSSSSSSAASSCSPGSNLLSTCKARLSSVSLPASPFKTVLRNSNDQEQMIAMIRSALGPKLRVHLGFIPNVWNSHAVIVCQFPGEKGLEYHEEGRSIIQHWADHFSLI